MPNPNQSVEVTFDPNANPQFTFVPDVVTMTRAGKILLHRRPNDAPWRFKDAYVKDNASGQFTAELQNEQLLKIDDKWTDGRKTYHSYTVTVEFEWNSHTQEFESPDPVIVNDPGARVSFLPGANVQE
jgi:hypothetical protein